jgi:hypothetical protein
VEGWEDVTAEVDFNITFYVKEEIKIVDKISN